MRVLMSQYIYVGFSSPHSHEGTDSVADLTDVIVVLNNFRSKIIKVQVRKEKPFLSAVFPYMKYDSCLHVLGYI